MTNYRMEAQFIENLKKINYTFSLTPNEEKYEQIVQTIQSSIDGEKLNNIQKTWNARYTLRVEDGKNVLYRENLKLVKENELFELLDTTHKKLGHSGRDGMWRELKKDYSKISKEVIMEYVKLCEHCTAKQAKAKKSIVINPILSDAFNSRCQVDLIDLQSRPDREWRFVMVYQDHLTKYVILNALERKTASNVAEKLIKIFADFGSPRILQSDNGKEFANQIVKEVCRQWKDIKIVHGKPRHSQSQGSVERSNRDIMDILTIEMREEKTTQWARLLPMVQTKKNRRYHRGIGRSPYEAMFGGKTMQIGNEDGKIPTLEERGLTEADEEQMEEFITIDGNEFVTEVEDRYVPIENEDEGESADDSAIDLDLQHQIEDRDNAIEQQREGARQFQKKQAEKMLEESSKRFAPIVVGTNVRLRIEDVDRSKVDPRNAIGVVLSEENGFYQIGTSGGILKSKYARNQIEPCATTFVQAENVPPKEITIRELVASTSVSGTTQGHVHCNCTTKCGSRICSCVRAGVRCNSRCHHSNTCNNKIDED